MRAVESEKLHEKPFRVVGEGIGNDFSNKEPQIEAPAIVRVYVVLRRFGRINGECTHTIVLAQIVHNNVHVQLLS